ncbi:MAG: hypothetical protein PVI86_06695 [Phycisphaerae bacterium]|jgi:hypothetical protein
MWSLLATGAQAAPDKQGWLLDFFAWLLNGAAHVVLAVWGWIVDALGYVFHGLDVILEPVLSPVLGFLNPVCTLLADAVYAVIGPLPPWLSLTILSGVTGVLALVVFRYTSNQKAIGRALDDIKANLLALKLYKDELRVTFAAQVRLLWAIARLQRYMLTPFLVMLGPMLLALAQMGLRHQWRPLEPGEQALVTVTGASASANPLDVQLGESPGLIVEAGPVPGGGKAVWRVRGGEPGRYHVQLDVNGAAIEKELVVGTGFVRVSASRVARDWTEQLFHPVEPLLPKGSPVTSIEIGYPGVESWITGANWWVLTFFIISMVVALIFKPLFKVRF